MEVLNIAVDLGAGASPVELETMVRGVRVATDIGREAQLRSVRRAATEQMKFPTDSELADATEQLPGQDEGLSRRARQHLEARRELEATVSELPYRLWRGDLFRYLREVGSPNLITTLSNLGYERAFPAAGTWTSGSLLGLDVIDPELYQALVALKVARLAPDEIIVRQVRYSNPFGEELAAVGTGAEALSKAAGAIETIATLPDRRAIKKVDRRVAEATEQDRIQREHEQTRRARLENELLEQELLAKQIQNVQALALDPQQQKQLIIQLFVVKGHLDLAEAAEAVDASDASALMALGARRPQLERSTEPDPEGND